MSLVRLAHGRYQFRFTVDEQGRPVSADWRRHWIVAFVLWIVMGVGFAQTTSEPQFEATPANLDCLLPVAADRGVPIYPVEDWAEQRSATVKVKLTFYSATLPPKAELVGDKRFVRFENSVAEYVSRYRLPCFVEGQAPIVTDQTFTFSYNDQKSVVYDNVGHNAGRSHWKCVEHNAPKYPMSSRHVVAEGNVVLSITFVKRDEEPKVDVIYGARDRQLQAAAVRAAKNYRYKCDIPEAEPVVAQQRFHFRLVDGKVFGLRDLDLSTFLGSVEREGLGKVRFDFNEMGCPFDLNINLYRPYARNTLGQFGQPNAKRKPFMDWLAQLTMRFSAESEPYLIGQSIKVSVPCAILDLT